MKKIEKIKKLREETQISISECKKALEEAGWDLKRAREILKERFGILAQKVKEGRVKEGIIEAYVHSDRKLGAMVKLCCESDFVARSEEFKKLAHEICLQIAAVDPKENPLLEQNWIKDESRKIKDLIDEYKAKFGENIVIEEYCRFKI